MCLTAIPQPSLEETRRQSLVVGGGIWTGVGNQRGRGQESYKKGRDRRLSRAGVVAGSIPTASRTPVSMLCSFNSLKQHTRHINFEKCTYVHCTHTDRALWWQPWKTSLNKKKLQVIGSLMLRFGHVQASALRGAFRLLRRICVGLGQQDDVTALDAQRLQADEELHPQGARLQAAGRTRLHTRTQTLLFLVFRWQIVL